MKTGILCGAVVLRGLLPALMCAWCTAQAGGLEEDCEAALAQSEVAVARARSREALWTTAAGALREARRLRRERVWSGCVDASTEARRLSELGLAQLEYPPERDWSPPGSQ